MHEIKWYPEAKAEYLGILDFWILHNQSAEYSLKIIYEVEEAEDRLKLNPKIGTKIKGGKDIRRVLILRNFSIYYTIFGNTIQIISFQDNRDNPQKIEKFT